MRSPLRYPGGKTRARSIIVPKIQRQRATRLISPFIGGASIELAWLKANPAGACDAFDLYSPLADFWRHTLSNPQGVATLANMHMPLDKKMFKAIQAKIKSRELSGIEMAAAFFVINRASFSGATNSGGMSTNHPRFNTGSVDRLRDFRAPGLSVAHACAFDVLSGLDGYDLRSSVIYLDPPYALDSSTLYGDSGSTHEDFNHAELAKKLRALSDQGWRFLMSYNECETVRHLYNGLTIERAAWSYGMRLGASSEVLIYSEGWAA